MKIVKIKHDLRSLRTEIMVNDCSVSAESPLFYVNGKCMQDWIKSGKQWKGLFQELRDAVGSKNLRIVFYGSKADYENLCSAWDNCGDKCFESIDFIYEDVDDDNRCSEQKICDIKRLCFLLHQLMIQGKFEDKKSYHQNQKDDFSNVHGFCGTNSLSEDNNLVGRCIMKTVSIKYNPYSVRTEIKDNGRSVSTDSPLAYVCDKRLQEWIEPGRNWHGLFREIRDTSGTKELRILFTGTKSDFEDLRYARDKYGCECFENVELVHVNADKADNISSEQKIQNIKQLYEKLQGGPIAELKTEDIRHNFESALNSDFRIVVVAPMSSGKSTLINAIVGKDLLPAFNQATTAVTTEIRDCDGMEKFVVTATSRDGDIICHNANATKEYIEQLNSGKDAITGMSQVRKIHIDGDIPNISSRKLNVVFVDTPGGNNSQNEEHEKVMVDAINDEDKSLILYVFNGTQLATNDSDRILKKIADTMKKASNGKQTRDRFLFVANRMDDFDVDKEPYEEVVKNIILPQLQKYGIDDPRLFLASAETAKLVRMYNAREKLSEDEKDKLEVLIKKFNRGEKRNLSRFASLGSTGRVKLESEREDVRRQIDAGADQEKIDKLRIRMTELQSGIPAIERAINEYIEKYAVAIKIKALQDTFMGKVRDRQIFENAKVLLAKSETDFENTKRELGDRQQQEKNQEMFKKFLEKVDTVTLADFQKINDIRKQLSGKIVEMTEHAPEKITEKECEYHCNNLSNWLSDEVDNAFANIKVELDEGLTKKCQTLVDEYTKQIKQYDETGILQIGIFDVSKLQEFRKIGRLSVGDLLANAEISVEKVHVGDIKVEKEGIWSGIKRFFGVESGWETHPQYRDEKFILYKRFILDKMGELNLQIDREINRKEEEIRRKEQVIKDYTKESMGRVKEYIEGTRLLIEQLVKDKDKLKTDVEKNKKQKEWLDDFIRVVNSVLDI